MNDLPLDRYNDILFTVADTEILPHHALLYHSRAGPTRTHSKGRYYAMNVLATTERDEIGIRVETGVDVGVVIDRNGSGVYIEWR